MCVLAAMHLAMRNPTPLILIVAVGSLVSVGWVAATEGSLNLASLESGLRGTKAVGVFTKLSLAGEAERLTKDLVEYHEGKPVPTLDELRVRYDLIINKILLLTQDADPPLAREVVATREPLWAALADPSGIKAL